MRVLFVASLCLAVTVSAWLTPNPGRQVHSTTLTTTTTARTMNIFADFFKGPTYKKPEPETEEKPVAKQEENVAEPVPDVQELDAQKEELSALQKEEPAEEPVVEATQEEVQEEIPVENAAEKEQKVEIAVAEEAPDAPASSAHTERLHGTVEWFSVPKGYGFIRPAKEGEENIFVHYSGVHMEGFRLLRQGQRVSYLTESTGQGKIKAVDVMVEAKDKSV